MIEDVWSIQLVDETDTDVILDADYVRRLMAEAEENMTDLLPEGYRAEIRRWNDPTQEDDDE